VAPLIQKLEEIISMGARIELREIDPFRKCRTLTEVEGREVFKDITQDSRM